MIASNWRAMNFVIVRTAGVSAVEPVFSGLMLITNEKRRHAILARLRFFEQLNGVRWSRYYTRVVQD